MKDNKPGIIQVRNTSTYKKHFYVNPKYYALELDSAYTRSNCKRYRGKFKSWYYKRGVPVKYAYYIWKRYLTITDEHEL